MQNEAQLQLLETEVAIGHQANATWESIKPFFDEKREALLEAFYASSVHEPERLVSIKMQMNVLIGLEAYFHEKITTAKLATIALRSEEHGT